ncbi:MAG: nucleotide-binding protein [Gemmatimonadetes bacterium]|nr:nucleotide-binding protein [Gemmatimonadota bacterium]
MRGTLFVLLAAAVSACGYSSKSADTEKVPLSEAPAVPGAADAAAPAGALAGPVLEKLDAPPYSYLKIKTSQGETWAAVPQTATATGAMVRVYNPMLMTKFDSKSLKRTFDEIYFGTLTPDGSDAAVSGAGAAGPADAAGAGANPHSGMPATETATVNVGKVEKATGPDAYTIAELFAKKDALTGKTVTVRGTVVKYNAQVMGKNWIHIQDGSGDAAKATNDVTITTMDETAKGKTITVRGVVKTSKDFGAGYKYAVIIEEAKITKP